MPPRTSNKPRGATPARSTRASSALPTDTPATRRRTRNATREPESTAEIVANPALPEVSVVQSYAYGSSKVPALPEQLHAQKATNIHAMADRLNIAAETSRRNLDARVAEFRGHTPMSDAVTSRGVKVVAPEPQLRLPPEASPDEVRKQERVADWVESSKLEPLDEESDEPEEEPVPREQRGASVYSRRSQLTNPQRQDREGSEPSSFPEGSFMNYSYNYERQGRPARPVRSTTPPSSKLIKQLDRYWSAIECYCQQIVEHVRSTQQRLRHMLRTISKKLYMRIRQGLAECWAALSISNLSKLLVLGFIPFLLALGYLSVCKVYSHACVAGSQSYLARALEPWCQPCQNQPQYFSPLPSNFTSANGFDLTQLGHVLSQITSQIHRLEARLSDHIASQPQSLLSDLTTLRTYQAHLETRLADLESSASGSSYILSSPGVASPILPQQNFFSPSSGAIIEPKLTSPTLQVDGSSRSIWRSTLGQISDKFGVTVLKGKPPLTAIEPWQDEGDCWCAAEIASPQRDRETSQSRQSTMLAVQTGDLVYPTELIVEHMPFDAALGYQTAPRDLELWADISHIAPADRPLLQTSRLSSSLADATNNEAQDYQRWLYQYSQESWARVGSGRYEQSTIDEYSGAKRNHGHVQRFSLDWNQDGLKYYADRFIVRILTNHGSNHTCLYRVRLHGAQRDIRAAYD